MRLGIVGHGIVGKAVEFGFQKYFDTWVHDKYQLSLPLEEVVKGCNIIFVCVPTPMFPDYSGIDLSIINEVVEQINGYAQNTSKIIVIKSTVVPGTTAKYMAKYPKTLFAFNPEFLTEANYLQDFITADRTVIGTAHKWVESEMVNLYKTCFPQIPIYTTTPTNAEMVKYFCNAYLATKVIFGNEMKALCDKLGVNYAEMKQMATADHRIFDSHLDVTEERGFGGKCFPKDVVALIGLYKKLKVDASLLKTVWKKNLAIRKDRDWEKIPFAASNRL